MGREERREREGKVRKGEGGEEKLGDGKKGRKEREEEMGSGERLKEERKTKERTRKRGGERD